MNASGSPGPRDVLIAVVIAVGLVAGCGGGSTAAVTTTLPPAPISTVFTSSSDQTTSTTSRSTLATGGSLVPTTLPPPVADLAIDRSLIPEATAGYEFSATTINGVGFPTALRISSSSSPLKVEIDAGRSRKRFLGTLGIPDDQKSSSSHQVDISLDNGPSILSVVINFGEVKAIDLDATNVLRIRLTVVSKTTTSGTVAIGNPRFG